jgi:hypothetical protein
MIFALSSLASGIGGVVGGSNDGKLSPSHDWEQIRKVIKGNQKFKISGDSAYVGQIVSIFDVCTDGENLITTKKLPVYRSVRVPIHMDNNDTEKDGWASKVVDHKIRSYPLNAIQKKRVCYRESSSNCKLVDKEFNQRTVKEITIKKFFKEEGSEKRKIYKKLFTKDYHVPNCN